jgi:hypothetical protein
MRGWNWKVKLKWVSSFKFCKVDRFTTPIGGINPACRTSISLWVLEIVHVQTKISRVYTKDFFEGILQRNLTFLFHLEYLQIRVFKCGHWAFVPLLFHPAQQSAQPTSGEQLGECRSSQNSLTDWLWYVWLIIWTGSQGVWWDEEDPFETPASKVSQWQGDGLWKSAFEISDLSVRHWDSPQFCFACNGNLRYIV